MDPGARRLAALRGHLAPAAAAAVPIASGCAARPPPRQFAAPGLLGLTVSERYFFETQGYVVIPDILTLDQLGELNAAVDACQDIIPRREVGAPAIPTATRFPGTFLERLLAVACSTRTISPRR